MNEFKDRIKKIRTSMEMTQDDFGKKIGLARNSVANYEIGRREPSNAIILSICKEFNANEEWLRTGKGEMFNKMDAMSTTYNHFGYIMGNATAQKKSVLSALV